MKSFGVDMKPRVIYTRGFVDTRTGENFNASLSLKGWRLSLIAVLIRVLTFKPMRYVRVAAKVGYSLCFSLALFLLVVGLGFGA
jgi:hypothetical protein